ncbi:hypothetical protein D9613_012374 [Agrocybe pediades]|uniref:Uncharacterized protein n=1 Tax=Agrocybe pediades TaxID=84607 RepID=A0A8H4VM78_9AGAR|nr:hypothetical protein D9613_012374 [Agrocybe pediades]
MAKTATVTKTKTATKSANEKTAKPKKDDGEEKPKRELSAYQKFCKENMKKWNEENPGRRKEAMSQPLSILTSSGDQLWAIALTITINIAVTAWHSDRNICVHAIHRDLLHVL